MFLHKSDTFLKMIESFGRADFQNVERADRRSGTFWKTHRQSQVWGGNPTIKRTRLLNSLK